MTDAEYLAWLESGDRLPVVLVEAVARISSTETTLYLSNRPYATLAAETPASTAYENCVTGGITFASRINIDGAPSVSTGDIQISNPAGVRDGWLDYVWTHRAISVYLGDARWPRADFRKIFDGTIDDLDSDGGESLSIVVMDKLQRLNNPITETLLGGSSVNKDRIVPLVFGEVFNIEPLLTNKATYEYQVHGGAIEDIIEVRDNGVPVPVTKTIATGKFTLGTAPVGQITCSVQGDKPSTYKNDIGSLIERITTAYGPADTRFSSGDLDSSNFTAFKAAYTQPVGLPVTERVNQLDACQRLANSVGAHMVTTSLGKLRLPVLALPAAGTPWTAEAKDMDYQSLQIVDRPKVRASCKLGYCPNFAPQESGLAGGLPADSVALLKDEWLLKTSTDATVQGIYKLDADPVQEDTLLLVETHATTEAARRRDLWKTQRAVYQFTGMPQLMLVELGDALTITHSRFGLSGGKTGVVVSVERDWLAGRVVIGVLA